MESYICAQIHDQIVVISPEKEVEKAKKMMQDIMENNYKISIPLKAPVEVGTPSLFCIKQAVVGRK